MDRLGDNLEEQQKQRDAGEAKLKEEIQHQVQDVLRKQGKEVGRLLDQQVYIIHSFRPSCYIAQLHHVAYFQHKMKSQENYSQTTHSVSQRLQTYTKINDHNNGKTHCMYCIHLLSMINYDVIDSTFFIHSLF